jgi:hypothetical protein
LILLYTVVPKIKVTIDGSLLSTVTILQWATVKSNMATPEGPAMADDYRAILTDREKEILRGDADVSEKYYYRVVTRVRDKIEELEHDLQILDEGHDTLGDELRETIQR